MTPLVAFRHNPIRVAAGIAAAPAKKDAPVPVEDPEELRRQLDAWNPVPVAILGLAVFRRLPRLARPWRSRSSATPNP